MKRNWFKNIVGFSSGLLGLAVATGCHGKSEKAAQAQMPPPPHVTVQAAQQKDIVEWDELTGRTEAFESVEVRPRVTGYIQEVRFQSGQMVKKGDVLFLIDPRWHQADFEKANAELNRAKVHLANAEREAKRTEQLLANKAISAEEAESRQSRFDEAQSAMLSAEAALNTVKLDLEHTEVRAPIDGKISRPYVTPGNHVSGVAGFTTLLTTIVTIDPVYVYADMDEATLLRFNKQLLDKKEGSAQVKALLQLEDGAGFAHEGHVESIDNRLDPGTGSILLRAVFPNPKAAILPGLFARLRVPAGDSHPAILIDEKSIGTDQSQKFVLTLTSSNTVDYRPITLGPIIDRKRVVRSGLKAGELVVVNGNQREKVRPGMPVVAETTEQPIKTAQN